MPRCMRHALIYAGVISFFCTNASELVAQTRAVSGYVQDASSGERLVGATVVEASGGAAATTNAYGFFSLYLASDSLRLIVSHVGYEPANVWWAADEPLPLTVELRPVYTELGTVEVVTERHAAGADVNRIDLPIAQVKELPVLMGEADVMKALQLLPGVQSGVEGSSGLYVRGGGPDQNLILLDGAPVYNAAHLFGFLSVFNPDALHSVELIKGGFPARYGGRLSSVVNVVMKEGNVKKTAGTASVGLVGARLTIEGPLLKDRSSYMVSVRRTYLDLLARRLQEPGARYGYYFYDFNAKFNYVATGRDRFYVSVYGGRDRLYSGAEQLFSYAEYDQRETEHMGIGWGNLTATARWTSALSRKAFASAMLLYSRYRFGGEYNDRVVTIGPDSTLESGSMYRYASGVRDWSARFDLEFFPRPGYEVKAGLGATHHVYNPGSSVHREVGSRFPGLDSTGSAPVGAVEAAAYLENEVNLTGRMSVNTGIHVSAFVTEGDPYISIQPRLLITYAPAESVRLLATFSVMRQYVHLLVNSGIGLPTDLWVPATQRVRPEKAHQASLGFTHARPGGRVEAGVEAFGKWMQGLAEYREGEDFFRGGQDWQSKVVQGQGHSYGIEVFLRKKRGRTTGWIGYTLSRTTREFETLNDGRPFPYKYDRRHDVSAVVKRSLSSKGIVAMTWVYGSGIALTFPEARYFLSFVEVEHYGSRNGYRMPPFHRLDVSYSHTCKGRWGENTFSVGVYNAYNRKNPFFVYLDNVQEQTGPREWTTRHVMKQVTLFPVLPFLNYSFSF